MRSGDPAIRFSGYPADQRTGGSPDPRTMFHRVYVHLPIGYVERVREANGEEGQRTLLLDVAARLERLGFQGVFVDSIMQDPTDNERITAIAVRPPIRGSASPLRDDVIQVLRVEEVHAPEPPPPFDPAWMQKLDPGLTPEEVWAVTRALGVETNPRHLVGFASTFEPWFPVAASFLRRKMILGEPYPAPRSAAPSVNISGEELYRRRASVVGCACARNLPLDIVYGEVKRAACRYVEETSHPLPEPLEDLPAEISGLGSALVVEGPRGIRVVDKERIRASIPSDGREGFVSPAALQLAMAIDKPGMSRVWNTDRIGSIVASLEEPPTSEEERIAQMRASLSLEKARATLSRGRWTRWYVRGAR